MRLLLYSMIPMFIVFSPLAAQSAYLVFGKGGGIAGTVTQYMVLDNGKVYKGTGRADILYSEKGKIRKPEAKKMYEAIENITDTSFHHPGNVYYFIQFSGDTGTVRYTWGDTGYQVPGTLEQLFRNMMNQVSGLKFNTLKKPLK